MLLDVSDVANEEDMYEVEEDSEFSIKDISVTNHMKMVFLLFGFIGLGFSLFHLGVFPSVMWAIVIVFMMELMGMFDGIQRFIRESHKPRGGYDNIE
jgi:hypothetical protein